MDRLTVHGSTDTATVDRVRTVLEAFPHAVDVAAGDGVLLVSLVDAPSPLETAAIMEAVLAAVAARPDPVVDRLARIETQLEELLELATREVRP